MTSAIKKAVRTAVWISKAMYGYFNLKSGYERVWVIRAVKLSVLPEYLGIFFLIPNLRYFITGQSLGQLDLINYQYLRW